MRARVEWQDWVGESAPASEEIRVALNRVMSSTGFAKAPRMCALLSFLVEKKLGGGEGGLTERAIGMQLFRRDAACYDTTTDPVVRVQMGRLRSRLADYYGAINEVGALQISIPAGSYVPVLRRVAPEVSASGIERLELAPLRCLSLDARNGAFVSGVDEELCSRLYLQFPAMLQVRDQDAFGGNNRNSGAVVRLRLEGSVRVERDHVRMSVRLVDYADGHTAWTAQFDSNGVLGIALQEEMAHAVCESLRDYFRLRTNTM